MESTQERQTNEPQRGEIKSPSDGWLHLRSVIVSGKDVNVACNAVEEMEAAAGLALMMRGIDARMRDAEHIGAVVAKFDMEWDD